MVDRKYSFAVNESITNMFLLDRNLGKTKMSQSPT